MLEAQGHVISLHEAGSMDPDELNALIVRSWSGLITNPVWSKEISEMIGVSEEKLHHLPPPVCAEVRKGGLTGAEMAIIFSGGFFAGLVKELGVSVGKSAADQAVSRGKDIWRVIMRRGVLAADPEAIGAEREPD